jgi:hypothetical protein
MVRRTHIQQKMLQARVTRLVTEGVKADDGRPCKSEKNGGENKEKALGKQKIQHDDIT